MRRRRVLALGAAAAGLAGYEWYVGSVKDDVEDWMSLATHPAGPRIEGVGDGGSEAGQSRRSAKMPSVGGTLNGRPHRIRDDLALIEESNTTWMHSFLDVRMKYEGDVAPEDDPDVDALRLMAEETGTRLIVSLRWDFEGIWGDKETRNVPPSGSTREQALFEYATELLEAIGRPVDVLVLGNEPVWETPDEDVGGGDAPLFVFTRRLKDHLGANYVDGDTRLLLGAFNRLYDRSVWGDYQDFYRQLFDLARSDDSIDGIDLHVHYGKIEEAETMLATARKAVPGGLITATEFSPLWRYVKYRNEPIGSFDGGESFADRYGFSQDTTVREYFRAAKDDPRPRDEMADFMSAMPWYNVNFVEDMYDRLNEYDVEVGTIGFMQGVGIRNETWGPDWRPFTINYLYQRGLIATGNGAHPHYLDDYRKRA